MCGAPGPVPRKRGATQILTGSVWRAPPGEEMVYMYISTYMCINIYIHYIYVDIYIYIYIYVEIYVYIYIYIHRLDLKGRAKKKVHP